MTDRVHRYLSDVLFSFHLMHYRSAYCITCDCFKSSHRALYVLFADCLLRDFMLHFMWSNKWWWWWWWWQTSMPTVANWTVVRIPTRLPQSRNKSVTSYNTLWSWLMQTYFMTYFYPLSLSPLIIIIIIIIITTNLACRKPKLQEKVTKYIYC